jgi:hypothetical protein
MRRLEFAVLFLVEAENDAGSLDHDGTPDQVGVFHHQGDRLLLRFRQRPLLEHRAARADEIKEPIAVDVPLEELPRGRFLVDVDLVDIQACRIQKTSGVFAGGSGGLGIERRLGHGGRIIEKLQIADCRLQIADLIVELKLKSEIYNLKCHVDH